ncbi:MAG: hypothetical protein ACOC89_03720 [Candidatus Saliniplasma sp.]
MKKTPKKEWIKVEEELVCKDRWIIDGTYGSTMTIRLKKADMI